MKSSGSAAASSTLCAVALQNLEVLDRQCVAVVVVSDVLRLKLFILGLRV